MTMLTLMLIVAQIGFHEEPPITLEAAPFVFDQVTPTPTGLLVCDQEKGLVHLFDRTGKLTVSLGAKGGAESLTLPTSANWLANRKKYYVYDAALRNFHIWDETFKFVEAVATSFPPFFEVGPLLETQDGFVASVSLTDEDFLLGRFGDHFDFPSFGYKVKDSDLKKVSPVLYRTFVGWADMYGGPKIFAVQSLSNAMTILNPDLEPSGSVPLIVTSWREPNYKHLQKLAKNPRELERYAPQYSEVIALQVIQGSLFVAGFRNVLDGQGYYFQGYDASTGKTIGQTYQTSQKPVGSGHGYIYLKASGSGQKLIPIKIQ